MRQIINFNSKWAFSKNANNPPSEMPQLWDFVNLPHTWNNIDGQDGNNDYYRGRCFYAKKFAKTVLPESEMYFLEINGANSSAEVYLNGEKITEHDGGYSTWRVDMTKYLLSDNLLVIAVDNSPNDLVYPQMADFTFYGGLYRDVNVICVSESHFDLEYFGGPGIKITPTVKGNNAIVEVEVYIKNKRDSQSLYYVLKDRVGNIVGEADHTNTKTTFEIENVHLWNGKKDPYLYTAEVFLYENQQALDKVSAKFGCRSFKIDSEKGFFLNGKEYPLRGVSRHQDRWEKGNALRPEHHEEDIDLIMEAGANTVRLAHYQHDQYFYNLCDEKGLIVWAEIPYISHHLPEGNANTVSQMKELVTQNYNHPSICFWGLSNEITMKNAENADILENHRILNDLCHKMDYTRLTTVAAVSHCPMNSEYLKIPDLVCYNHYFGWYGGDTSMNGPWFDEFHRKHPDIPIGCSEYGCEALNWHTSTPTQGDYTEEYQAYYHEELIQQLFPRKYIWATYVWNMFDFGADARNEGGENGQNHKGLVTFDRKYKKDAFYAYKAWLSDEPFIHICGKRYVERAENKVKITVYSNLPEVELFLNGKSFDKKTSENHFFKFEIPNIGETEIVASAGIYTDKSIIRKVDAFNEKYRLKEKNAVLNWFDITEKEGFLSLNDKISDILATSEGKALLGQVFSEFIDKNESLGGFEITKDMMKMLGGFTFLRFSGMVGMMGINFTKEKLLEINTQLNKISKA